MKKFLKTHAVLTALLLASICITACESSNSEDSASVTLSGSTDGYRAGSSSNLLTEGGLYNSWSNVGISTSTDDCPAGFKISGSSFRVTIFENQSLNSGTVTIYNTSGTSIGYVRIYYDDGDLKLSYTEY